MERKDPIEANKDDLEDYTRTYELLFKYIDIIYPFRIFWPKLDLDQYQYEYDNIVILTQDNLDQLNKILSQKVNKDSSLSVKNWKAIVSEVKTEFSIFIEGPTEPVLTDKKIEISQGNSKTVKEIFLDLKNNPSNEKLIIKLQKRFLVHQNQARRWVNEYYKYLIIKLQSRKSHPPRIIRYVLQVHMEDTKSYRDFNQQFKFIHSYLGQNESNLKAIYSKTLSGYESIFKEKPDTDLWPPTDVAFSDRDQRIHTINLFRYVVCLSILQHNALSFEHSNPIQHMFKRNDNFRAKVGTIRNSRKEAEIDKQLYSWRTHFTNFYEITTEDFKEFKDDAPNDAPINEIKQEVIKELDTSKYKLDQLYDKGGFVFITNPFEQRNIYRNYIIPDNTHDRIKDVKDILSQDDLADYFHEQPEGESYDH